MKHHLIYEQLSVWNVPAPFHSLAHDAYKCKIKLVAFSEKA
jgi:hypothetical protein